MVNEKRQLIECLKHCADNAACEECLRWDHVCDRLCVDDLMVTAAEELEKLVDAVEVTRCKDCKSYDPGYIRPYCGWCSTWETAVRESGYCHHGERKDNDRLSQ